jgi:short-subunit dehydrogenase
VVTGAASGIGRALALELAARGTALALLDVDRGGLEAIAARCGRCTAHLCDVADAGAVQQAARAVEAAHGSVHALFNNAGIYIGGTVEELSLERFRRAMGVNFWGVVHGCLAFLPRLRDAAARGEPAALCNVLSPFALLAVPSKATYAASKFAARAFTEALAAELHGSGVSVTAIYPGATATSIVAHGEDADAARHAREASFIARGMPPEVVARKVVRAVERGRARRVVGRDARLVDLLVRLSPGLVGAALRRYWRRAPFL